MAIAASVSFLGGDGYRMRHAGRIGCCIDLQERFPLWRVLIIL